MDIKKLERRNSSLDIIRIVAVFTVLSVHFFLHNGFYSEPVSGKGPIEGLFAFFSSGNVADLHGPQMFIMVEMRVLFGVCVPLFMILTGYLMSKKELSKGYYKGIRKTLIIFVLATIACMIFKSIHETPAAKAAFYNFNFEKMFEAINGTGKYDLKHYIFGTLDFTGANYSWYIEMYIGLFLMAPFLNLGYNKLKSKRQKQVLVFTFVFLTVIPTVFNIFNFDSASWWMNPTENDTYQKLIPSFWMGIYPITYYYIGAYLREYGIRLKTKPTLILFLICEFLFGAFSFFRSYGGGFKSSIYVYWYGFEPCVLATLLFVLLSRIKTDNWSPYVKTALWKVSDLALGIYLMSFVFDSLIYDVLTKPNSKIFMPFVHYEPVMVNRLPYYFITVPLCFILSLAASFILNKLEQLIVFLYEKIKVYVITQKSISARMFWQDVFFAVLIVAGFIFSIWKAQFGFGGNDEAFYLTIPERLLKGDGLFVDEWHLSQMSGVLQLPLVWLYTTFAGSTTGIIYAMRIFYIVLHCAASVLIYTKLRKYGILAVIGSALFFIYTPYDIMALSYDSMGLGLVTLAGVLIATANYEKKLQIIFSGLCFAGAVLCCPYLAVAYVLYAICMLVHIMMKNSNAKFALKSEMFSLRTFLFFTLGAGILAVIFLVIFIIPKGGFGGVFENLPYMLKDPEHSNVSFFAKLPKYFETIFNCHPNFKYAVYAYAVMMIVLIFDRKRKLHRSLYLLVTIGIVIFTYVLLLEKLHSTYYNAIMFPMIFIGITSYILCDNKPRELFVSLFILGIIYSICVHVQSNQYFYIISMALASSNVASYIFLAQLIRDMKENPDNITYAVWLKRTAFALVVFTVFLQGALQISTKAHHVFWEGEPDTLTAKIEDGPAAGIYTNDANAMNYKKLYDDIAAAYEDKDKGNLLVMSEKTWLYLAANNMDYGTFSAWLSGENDGTLQRLNDYYTLNPDKAPKYIYIPKDSKWDTQRIEMQSKALGYKVKQTENSYQLEKKY